MKRCVLQKLLLISVFLLKSGDATRLKACEIGLEAKNKPGR